MGEFLSSLFALDGQVAVVTGGTGVLGSAMARGLAQAGATVAILGRDEARAAATVAAIRDADGDGWPLLADVLERSELEAARTEVLQRHGRIDILVNGAGGNRPGATVSQDVDFFQLPQQELEAVVSLNLMGTILSCQVFGQAMARQERGTIINISSMTAQKPLTRVAGYGAAKAAVENLTAWLAEYLTRTYSPELRVNAIAPGFFIGEQNRRLLLDENGELTPRGRTIVEHTPMQRFGNPDDLLSTLIWLCGPGARFVNGVVIPVDGGFSAFGGV